jgi:hypothetical protein
MARRETKKKEKAFESVLKFRETRQALALKRKASGGAVATPSSTEVSPTAPSPTAPSPTAPPTDTSPIDPPKDT